MPQKYASPIHVVKAHFINITRTFIPTPKESPDCLPKKQYMD